MTSIEKMTDEEFERHAFGILEQELGVDGLFRFIRLNFPSSRDYTRDRHQWLDGVTLDEIMAELEVRKEVA